MRRQTDKACRVCASSRLEPLPEFESFSTVSSDCFPCAYSARLACCSSCGAVQKVIDDGWRSAVRKIYETYSPYHQANGNDQRVFDSSGASLARSERFLSFVLKEADIPSQGSHLDIGCGNGNLLAAMHQLRPRWTLHGQEIGDLQRETVCGLPGVNTFYSGPLTTISRRFDLLTLAHVLEHVESPERFLAQAMALLEQNGILAVELPDWSQNPFDLLIFDHCTHFDPATLQDLCARVGLTGTVRTDQVPKEISAALRPGAMDPAQADPAQKLQRAMRAAQWLASVRDQARQAADQGPIGIFGTAIGATWLHGELNGRTQFFVDENPAMTGSTFMGKPVYAPGDAPRGHL